VAHFLQVLLRLVLALVIALALPLSHDIWGEPYPGDGQKGFGVLMMLAVYGMGIASAYVVLGSIGQFFLRRKAFRISLLFDVSLFALITLILVIAGVQAKYGEVEAAQSSSASHSQVARVHV
jgi:hypothetical protein